MTEQSSGPGRPDDWSRGGYVPDEQYAGEQYYGASGSGSARPGSGMPGQGGSGYGNAGPGGSGYGSSGQGAGRPAPGTPGAGGAPGPGMPTTPIWQATPGPAAPGQGGPGQGASGQAAAGQAGFGPGATPPPGGPMGSPTMGAMPMGRPQAADARGFLGALFDLSFTSFVTTKIIKVLYALILVLTSLSALVYTIVAFRLSAGFGLLVLVIGDPLFIIIVMAFWRLVLESFVVVFRIAEDVRAMRERAGR
jgi:hypothetical protein